MKGEAKATPKSLLFCLHPYSKYNTLLLFSLLQSVPALLMNFVLNIQLRRLGLHFKTTLGSKAVFMGHISVQLKIGRKK